MAKQTMLWKVMGAVLEGLQGLNLEGLPDDSAAPATQARNLTVNARQLPKANCLEFAHKI